MTAAKTPSFIGLATLTLIMAILGSTRFFRNGQGVGPIIWLTLQAGFFFGLIPLLLWRYAWHRPVAEIGWCRPRDTRRAMRDGLIVFALSIPVLILFARQDDFRTYYQLGSLRSQFILVGVLLPMIYYTAEELLFRGLFLLPLWAKYRWRVIVVNILLFAALHLGKPIVEIAFALAAGGAFCWLTIRHRSMWPAAAVHLLMTLTLLILITFVWPTVGAGNYHF